MTLKLSLKDFQSKAVETLLLYIRAASKESKSADQAILLSSPTGSGKTLMMTAVIERIFIGDGEYAPDDKAIFLWISDQPELNEQTYRKMLETSSILDVTRLISIGSSFDQEMLHPGHVYFLNIQKLAKETRLVTKGDDRQYTIWETLTNTVKSQPSHFFVIIDEAHRGMGKSGKDIKEAASIIQKFIKGSSEITAVPIIIGISATPERFQDLIRTATSRIYRPVNVPAADVRASGLLKEKIRLFYPDQHQPSDMSMLTAATQKWQEFIKFWSEYCIRQGENSVSPILVVQVQDSKNKKDVSATDISNAIQIINSAVGTTLPSRAYAHSFQEGKDLDFGNQSVRYIAPPDIVIDSEVKVIFFKTSLNTGWDCPRAEVMMSFRKAFDATNIAQLVGRMVRTPLARRIDSSEILNTVALYLPHYDKDELLKVIQLLTSPDPDVMPTVEIEMGNDVLTLNRSKGSDPAFEYLGKIPTYIIPKKRKITGVRRLFKLARLLANDEIYTDAVDDAKKSIINVIRDEYNKVKGTNEYKEIVETKGKIKIKAMDWQLNGTFGEEDTITIDIATENINDLFETAGRKFGEGLHKAWWKDQVEDDENAKTSAKLEIVALATSSTTLAKIEEAAQKKVRDWLSKYRLKIDSIPEARHQAYIEVRQLAVDSEETMISYPNTIEVRKEDTFWSKHLYVDEKDKYPCKLNNWEKKVIEAEIAKGDVIIGWLRNIDRKSWSLTIPYDCGGDIKPLYPDFLIIRNTNEGIVVDILDPHELELADAPAKAAGLAKFAAKHFNKFGRIELIIIKDGIIKRLDLVQENIRDKVKSVKTKEHLDELFNSDGES